MSDVRVSVLMSTYNGEKFIREQLDSILHQKNVDVQLLIRDDGSTDSTIEIINEYAERYQNVLAYEGKNIGIGKSFMELVSKAPNAAYYAFADQDDVWLEDKLARAVKVIRETERSVYCATLRGTGRPVIYQDIMYYEGENTTEILPVLYGSNQTLVNSRLEPIGIRFQKDPECSLYPSISSNLIYGCTMVFNDTLKELTETILLPDEIVLRRKNHDGWMIYCAYIFGIFVYDRESKMLYRQHENNAVGAAKIISGKEYVIDKWKRLRTKKNKCVRSTLAGNLLDRLSGEMNEDMKNELELLRDANSLRGAIRVCRDAEWSKVIPESKWKFVLRGIMKWI